MQKMKTESIDTAATTSLHVRVPLEWSETLDTRLATRRQSAPWTSRADLIREALAVGLRAVSR